MNKCFIAASRARAGAPVPDVVKRSRPPVGQSSFSSEQISSTAGCNYANASALSYAGELPSFETSCGGSLTGVATGLAHCSTKWNIRYRPAAQPNRSLIPQLECSLAVDEDIANWQVCC